MSVIVASCSLAELFAGEPTIIASDGSQIQGSLHLPEYQRPYRWGTPQLQSLLDDLRRYFNPATGLQPASHPFYLGSIILHQQNGEEDLRLNIIDGQQRLTTLGLLAWLQRPDSEPKLTYTSPVSQRQIRANLVLLKQQYSDDLQWLDFHRINITLVVTRSEDDAYRFFETQNTGGVRLSGPDIIKAHHLRAIDRKRQNDYAKLWESLGDLTPLVDAVLKARHWHAIDFRPLPSHRQPAEVRAVVVAELAERTANLPTDMIYQQVRVTRTHSGSIQETPASGYAMRQPLNAGINAVHYLQYFHSLHQRLLQKKTEPELEDFHRFYRELICNVDGCGYLKKLFDSCLLLYASNFGTACLHEAALWLFRVVYSPRVSNQKAVRENTVPAFVKDNPVFDWILMSYTHQQCIERLSAYTYSVSTENLGSGDNGVKKRFVTEVTRWFGMDLPAANLAGYYDRELKAAIRGKSGYQGKP